MDLTATLSENFEISIPEAIRDANGWKAGQQFAFLPKDGGIMLAPVPALEDLVGVAKGAKATDCRDREDRY